MQNTNQVIAKRIAQKLLKYTQAEDPFVFAKILTGGTAPQYYRFRIGEYRAIFRRAEESIFIVKIGHRKKVYKRFP